MKSITSERPVNLVIHKNTTGEYTAYFDGVFGACGTSRNRCEAIAEAEARLEMAITRVEETGVPLVIGSDRLPSEDQCCFVVSFYDGAFERIAHEAIAAGVTINKYLEMILTGLLDHYTLETVEDEDTIHLIVERMQEQKERS